MRRAALALLLLACVADVSRAKPKPPKPSKRTPIGDVTTVSKDDRGVTLGCKDGSEVRVSLLAPGVARVRASFGAKLPAPPASFAIASPEPDWPGASISVHEEQATITVATDTLDVVIQRAPLLVSFRAHGAEGAFLADRAPMSRDTRGALRITRDAPDGDRYYGLGEPASPHLDLRGQKIVLWSSDAPGYTAGRTPLYQSVPFYLGAAADRAYGVFHDDTHRTTFDLAAADPHAVTWDADGGAIDYTVFAGPSIAAVLADYTRLTGRMPLPPRWTLGVHQSRYGYTTAAQIEEIAKRYRDDDLPLDAVWLDIDYMDGARAFTWDATSFPDPHAMIAKLGAQGVKVVAIVDPAIKIEKSFALYDAASPYLLHTKQGPFVGRVWPGKSVFPDFRDPAARAWWGAQHAPLIDAGVAAIWNDMNEPTDFDDPTGAAQLAVPGMDAGHDTYGSLMAEASYEGLAQLAPRQRPWVLTRAGSAGVQRYAATWTGDGNATWDGLALSVAMIQSLGLSGEPFAGADVGGFFGDADAELITRWYEAAFLTPFFRNHHDKGSAPQEPWRFGTATEDTIRAFLKLRYRLLPYLYTTVAEAHETGLPIVRPLALVAPDLAAHDDEFLIGADLLVAPVLTKGATRREVWLPPGVWYDFWSRTRVTDAHVTADAPIDRVPLYVRGGAILPLGPELHFTDEHPLDPLTFVVFPDATGAAQTTIYEDDGVSPSSAFRRTTLHATTTKRGIRIHIAPRQGSWSPGKRMLDLEAEGDRRSKARIRDTGKEVDLLLR